MNSEKYIGLDVHQATISVAVMDSDGKLVMESILETKAATILQFFAGLRGTLWVTFEEGTCAAWLYDLLNPHVAKLVVCNPRKNALLKYGNKSDRIDARKLAELLRGNHLKAVYHGENGVRTLRELARSYLTIVKDLTRVMSRLKALYRSWAIPCAGRDVYYTRHRAEWLGKIHHAGVRRRAEQLYQHLDVLQRLRQEVRRELLAESRKHPATAKLRQIPYFGPIRSALLVALIQTPHRFRTKRQLWAYSGLALETRTSRTFCGLSHTALIGWTNFGGRPVLWRVLLDALRAAQILAVRFGDFTYFLPQLFDTLCDQSRHILKILLDCDLTESSSKEVGHFSRSASKQITELFLDLL